MKNVEVVCAIIMHDNKIFCCKRGPNRSLEGYWEFPGGKVESHETHEETIAREIKEELNTIIKPIRYLTTVEHTYPDMDGYKGFHIIMHAYICSVVSGELEISEHVEKAWKTKEEMKQMKFAPADIGIINLL